MKMCTNGSLTLNQENMLSTRRRSPTPFLWNGVGRNQWSMRRTPRSRAGILAVGPDTQTVRTSFWVAGGAISGTGKSLSLGPSRTDFPDTLFTWQAATYNGYLITGVSYTFTPSQNQTTASGQIAIWVSADPEATLPTNATQIQQQVQLAGGELFFTAQQRGTRATGGIPLQVPRCYNNLYSTGSGDATSGGTAFQSQGRIQVAVIGAKGDDWTYGTLEIHFQVVFSGLGNPRLPVSSDVTAPNPWTPNVWITPIGPSQMKGIWLGMANAASGTAWMYTIEGTKMRQYTYPRDTTLPHPPAFTDVKYYQLSKESTYPDPPPGAEITVREPMIFDSDTNTWIPDTSEENRLRGIKLVRLAGAVQVTNEVQKWKDIASDLSQKVMLLTDRLAKVQYPTPVTLYHPTPTDEDPDAKEELYPVPTQIVTETDGVLTPLEPLPVDGGNPNLLNVSLKETIRVPINGGNDELVNTNLKQTIRVPIEGGNTDLVKTELTKTIRVPIDGGNPEVLNTHVSKSLVDRLFDLGGAVIPLLREDPAHPCETPEITGHGN
ncbi:capsid protein [French Guiana hepevirus]|nr:capsid protein [French Guiana hepevirus]